MGDVFDAMNRAKKDRAAAQAAAGGSAPGPQTSEQAAGNDTAPALPLDQVRLDALSDPTPAPRPPLTPQARPAVVHGLTEAVELSTAQERQKRLTAIPLHTNQAGPGAPGQGLNGYSAQIIVHHDRGSVITEQYRAIRTQILARGRNRKLQTHVITSSAPQEGKSVTTVNLGITFTELRNQKTLLVEGDLRRPAFHKLLNRSGDCGLIQLLRGEVDDLDRAIQPTIYDNLQFMPAGDRDFTASTELLSSPRMLQILDRLKDRYDHIFIDTPPVITVTDACILGAMADETLLVVRLGKTPSEVVDRAKRLLRAANCEVTGVILTHMQYHIPQYLYRYV